MEDKPQGTTPVKLEPCNWQWSCPVCSTINVEECTDEIVTCWNTKCGTSFFTNFKEED